MEEYLKDCKRIYDTNKTFYETISGLKVEDSTLQDSLIVHTDFRRMKILFEEGR